MSQLLTVMHPPMSFLTQRDLGEDFEPFVFFRNNFGFVPNLFRAQSLLPRVLVVETELTNLLLIQESALSPIQKQSILLAVGAVRQSPYCFTLHWETLRAMGLPEERVLEIASGSKQNQLSTADEALLDFSVKLSQHPLWISSKDFELLRDRGLSDEQILEAELIASYEVFACTLATGLGIAPDFPAKEIPRITDFSISWSAKNEPGSNDDSRPYLRAPTMADNFWPYPFFEEKLGFIPSFFRAQTLRPDVIEAQARALEAVLLTDDVLTRLQKEFIFLVISAANLNTFCVANHCGVLRGLGIPEDQSDQIAFNHRDSGLADADVALLDFALKLTQSPAEFSHQEIELLRGYHFTEGQILETIVLSGFANFINTMNVALGVLPDFEPKHVFKAEHLSARHDLEALGKISSVISTSVNLSGAPASLIDEDAGLVARVRNGDLDAFEDLVRRHNGRVYRTLIGVTGNPNDAEDYTQNVFLKAFKSIGKFSGTSKFSTWLTRIAINEGIEQLRKQRPTESLDNSSTISEGDFRPRQVQAWVDNPEQLYSRREMHDIVEREMMKLPNKYRVAVMLRDVEQLSNQEAAEAMNLELEAFKSRLLRGRLVLREALTSQFKNKKEGAARV